MRYLHQYTVSSSRSVEWRDSILTTLDSCPESYCRIEEEEEEEEVGSELRNNKLSTVGPLMSEPGILLFRERLSVLSLEDENK